MKVNVLNDLTVDQINQVTASFFPHEITSKTDHPEFITVIGCIGSGKSTYIKEYYAETHVLLDASAIYLKLNQGSWNHFGKKYEMELDRICCRVVSQSIEQRKSLATEVLIDSSEIMELFEKIHQFFKRISYKTIVIDCDCSLDTALARNKERNLKKDNVSSYFTTSHHINAILDVIEEQNKQG
ncbi:MAG: AAA family ATPase [Methylococcales bacterium]|jgi:predicted kinase|nr:AAA family ATPase [Methylococcales bacterium]